MKCKRCDAEVKDDKALTLALAGWGWTMAPDPGLGEDAHGVVPGWWYACPDCSDEDQKDAFAYELTKLQPKTKPRRSSKRPKQNKARRTSSMSATADASTKGDGE